MHVRVADAIAPRVEVFLVNDGDGRRQGPIPYVIEVCEGGDGHEPFIEQHNLAPADRHVILLPGWRPEIVTSRKWIHTKRRPSPRDCWDA